MPITNNVKRNATAKPQVAKSSRRPASNQTAKRSLPPMPEGGVAQLRTVGKKLAGPRSVDTIPVSIDDRRRMVREELMLQLHSRLATQEQRSLAERCIDDVMLQLGDAFEVISGAEFVDSLARSCRSVSGKGIPNTQLSLAFKLAFNLDFKTRLARTGAASTEPDHIAADGAWAAAVVGKMGPTAIGAMSASEGIGCAMLLAPENGEDVLQDSLPLSTTLLDRTLPNKIKPKESAAWANMAIALRNVAIRRVERNGPEVDERFVKATVKTSKALVRALLKAGQQPDPVLWTVLLLENAPPSCPPGG